ncbi:MAG: hypothetical protein ACRCXW_14200 [Plesiomonas shigelloides]
MMFQMGGFGWVFIRVSAVRVTRVMRSVGLRVMSCVRMGMRNGMRRMRDMRMCVCKRWRVRCLGVLARRCMPMRGFLLARFALTVRKLMVARRALMMRGVAA